jgi:hypothetical protein
MKDKTGTSKGSKKRGANLEEILEEIRRKPTVKVWPHAGRALGIGRGATYAAAARNEIDVIRIGHSVRAVSASLRKRLGIEGEHQ